MSAPDLDFEDEYPITVECPLCYGWGIFLGVLGKVEWYRCQCCGDTFHTATGTEPVLDSTLNREGN